MSVEVLSRQIYVGQRKLHARNFPIWKTIALGVGPHAAAEVQPFLESAGCVVDDWSGEILGLPVFRVSCLVVEIDLIVITPAEIGFQKGPSGHKLFSRIEEIGFEYCPIDAGPQLRWQYQNQPLGECLAVVSRPIEVNKNPHLFFVAHDEVAKWLHSYYNVLDREWYLDDKLVVCRPRRSRA